MNARQEPSEGFDLEQALAALSRRAPVIVACVALAALAAFVFSSQQPKTYTATASLAFSQNPLSQQIAGLPPSGNGTSPLVQQASNVELVKLGDMAQKTASRLGLSGAGVGAKVTVSGQGESGVVAVSARAGSPSLAAAIANTYVDQFVKEQSHTSRRYYASALSLVRRQLHTLSPAQQVGQDGLALQNRAQTLALLSELEYGSVSIAQRASPPSAASSPRTSRNVLLGGLLGLLLAIGSVFVLEQLDLRIKRPGDLAEIYGVPLLGSIPQSRALTDSSAIAPDSPLPKAAGDAFGLIGAHLRVLNHERRVRTVLVTSAARGDGASTIASRLAVASAQVGARVLLIDSDLREPRDSAAEPVAGLADVLAGRTSTDEAIRSLELEARAGDGRRRELDVLSAGNAEAGDPNALIESQATADLLGQASSTYDLVVIDTAPPADAPEVLSLLGKVDGVVIVGRLGRSRHDESQDLQQILSSSGAHLLGVIANGARARRRLGRRAPAMKRMPAESPSSSPAHELVST